MQYAMYMAMHTLAQLHSVQELITSSPTLVQLRDHCGVWISWSKLWLKVNCVTESWGESIDEGLCVTEKDLHRQKRKRKKESGNSNTPATTSQTASSLPPNQIWTSHPVQTTHRTQQTECPPLPQIENRPMRNVSLWYCPNGNRTLAPALPSARLSKGGYLTRKQTPEGGATWWPCRVEEDSGIREDHWGGCQKEAIDDDDKVLRWVTRAKPHSDLAPGLTKKKKPLIALHFQENARDLTEFLHPRCPTAEGCRGVRRGVGGHSFRQKCWACQPSHLKPAQWIWSQFVPFLQRRELLEVLGLWGKTPPLQSTRPSTLE